MGATTIWERWDSMLPDGTVNSGEMTSFNHYALGAVADWIYQVVGGIRPGAPGYEEVIFHPQPGPGITWADTSYESVRGMI
jgi:alpha-L-rhamnosidase